MTNKEKFIEIFKSRPYITSCPIYCTSTSNGDCPYCYSEKYCEAGDWWNKEYKADRSEEE